MTSHATKREAHRKKTPEELAAERRRVSSLPAKIISVRSSAERRIIRAERERAAQERGGTYRPTKRNRSKRNR